MGNETLNCLSDNRWKSPYTNNWGWRHSYCGYYHNEIMTAPQWTCASECVLIVRSKDNADDDDQGKLFLKNRYYASCNILEWWSYPRSIKRHQVFQMSSISYYTIGYFVIESQRYIYQRLSISISLKNECGYRNSFARLIELNIRNVENQFYAAREDMKKRQRILIPTIIIVKITISPEVPFSNIV